MNIPFRSLAAAAGLVLLGVASATAESPPLLTDLAATLGLGLADSLPPQPGPDDYAAFALTHNEDVAAALAAWEAAKRRSDVVGALPEPRLTWSEAIEPVETRVGPQERILALTQQVPWFGTLGLRRGIEDERAAAAGAQAASVVLAVVQEARTATAELAYLEQAVATARAHLELLVQWESAARARYETGAGNYADVIKAQVEIGALEDRVAGLQDRRRPLAARLNAAVGRAADAPVATAPLAPVTTEVDEESLRARMLATNPELTQMDHAAAGQLKAGELAGRRRYPDLSFGVNWVQVGAARMDGVADSGKDAVFATVGLSLPLWQGSYAAAEDEADARYRAVEHERSDLARRLSARLEQACFGLRDARRKLTLYRDTLLPKSHQSLEAARAAYAAGSASFLALVDAQRILLEFQLAAARAATDLVISRADIDRLVGGAADGGKED